jgi:hypothetical protein
MRIRHLAALLTALVVASLFAGSASQAASDQLQGAPKTGLCYNMTFKQSAGAVAPVPAISCSKAHTMWIVATGVPAAKLDLTKAADVQTAGDQVCGVHGVKKAVGDFGLKFAKSDYLEEYFAPSKAQIADGAHWLSCELSLDGKGSGFVTTRVKQPASLKKKLPDSFQLCGTAKYDTVACSAKHAFRAVYAFQVNKPFTSGAYTKAGTKTCPGHVSTPKGYSYTSRTRTAKSFTITCLTKTSK